MGSQVAVVVELRGVLGIGNLAPGSKRARAKDADSGKRVKLAEAIEAGIADWREPMPEGRAWRRWIKALEEMRRGMDLVAEGVKYLGDLAWEDLPGEMPIPRKTRRGIETVSVRFLDPKQVYTAQLWLDAHLGPRRAGGRPKEDRPVRVGVELALLFEQHGVRVTLGRFGRFAEALKVVLREAGLRAPEKDAMYLLRRIRDARAKRAADWERSARELERLQRKEARARK